MTLTPEQLAAWRKLAEEAARKPRGWDNELLSAREELAVRAIEIVPALLAEVERLTAALQEAPQ